MFYAKNWPFKSGANPGIVHRPGVAQIGMLRDERGDGYLLMSMDMPIREWDGDPVCARAQSATRAARAACARATD